MIIKNFTKLASTPERKIALDVANAGIEAITPDKVIKENIRLDKSVLTIKNKSFDLKEIKNIYVIGVGKAAFETGSALEKVLGDKITEGILLDINKGKLKHLESFVGTHPLPSEENIRVSKKIVKLVEKATKDDLIIALISGGASALFCLPQKASVQRMASLTNRLLRSGADIYEVNTVRKHLSQVKGGGLAKFAYPAKVVSLIFSDVPGDDLSFIASGPTVKDETTKIDAQRIIKKYDIRTNSKLFETPKDKKYFENVTNILLLSGRYAIEAMQKRCQELKVPCTVYSYALRGEAKIVGRKLLQRLPKSGIMVASGETTVKVEGKGKGGRNEELVLGALPYLEKTVFISLASDGLDNSEAAGAIGDEDSLKKSQVKNLNWREYIDNNDSFHFFKKLDDLIITGPTGTNVSDLIVIYKK
ncbi:MAG: DUF4147 domain-containing protein [Candidatus Paceibacterota bacterium]